MKLDFNVTTNHILNLRTPKVLAPYFIANGSAGASGLKLFQNHSTMLIGIPIAPKIMPSNQVWKAKSK